MILRQFPPLQMRAGIMQNQYVSFQQKSQRYWVFFYYFHMSTSEA